MMHRILFVLPAFILFSCSNPSSNTWKKPSSGADNFTLRFITAHGDIANNDVTFNNASDEFSKSVQAFVIDSMGAANLPMNIQSMKAIGNNVLVHFHRIGYLDLDIPKTHHIDIDIFALMNSTKVNQLIQSNDRWYVLPHYTKAAIMGGSGIPNDDFIYNGHGSITRTTYGYSYNFGAYLVEADSVIPSQY